MPRGGSAFQGVGFLCRQPDEGLSDEGKPRAQAQWRAPPCQARTASGVSFGEGRERTSSRPFAFEILVQSRTQERLSRIYADSLRRIGIYANVRLADEVQYERRRQIFDFDMLIAAWIASPSPGYEQRFLWGSQSADQEASYNLAGARSPAIDAMIAAMVAAKTSRGIRRCRESLRPRSVVGLLYRSAVLCTRAMDRLFQQARTSEVHSAVRGDNRQLVAEAALGLVDEFHPDAE